MWLVTFEQWTAEDCEAGDTDKRGIEEECQTFAEALSVLCPWIRKGGFSNRCIAPYTITADSWPLSEHNPPRWLSYTEYDNADGSYTRSLHIPDYVKPLTALRIAKLLGVK